MHICTCAKFLTEVILSNLNLDTNSISLNLPWFAPRRCQSLELGSNCLEGRHSWLEQHLILWHERLGQVELPCRGDKHKDVCTLQFIESDLPPHSVSYCFLNLHLSKEKKIGCTFKSPFNQENHKHYMTPNALQIVKEALLNLPLICRLDVEDWAMLTPHQDLWQFQSPCQAAV